MICCCIVSCNNAEETEQKFSIYFGLNDKDTGTQVLTVEEAQADGYTMFADNELLIDEGIYDYEVLIAYIQSFANGTISEQYRTTDGRISVQ